MPNHIHGILKIDHHLKNSKSPHLTSNTAKRVFVETLRATSLRRWMAQISPKKGSLSTVIRSFKSAVTKDARIINSEYHWQSRFHDSFIQDEQSLANIRAYIVNNPKNWHQDELNPEYKKTNKQNKKKK
jgi:REP element-mobilizing transposase RayT